MTSNQLTLGRLREDTRHNKEQEKIGYGTLAESRRHNIQSEAIGFGNIGLGYSSLSEQKRHNIATEDYQGQQARAYAGKADTDARYTALQIDHYLEELQVRKDQAEAQLRNAASQEERNRIEQQLADIKQQMVKWEKLRIGAEAFKDVTVGLGQTVDAVGDVVGLIKDRNSSIDANKREFWNNLWATEK